MVVSNSVPQKYIPFAHKIKILFVVLKNNMKWNVGGGEKFKLDSWGETPGGPQKGLNSLETCCGDQLKCFLLIGCAVTVKNPNRHPGNKFNAERRGNVGVEKVNSMFSLYQKSFGRTNAFNCFSHFRVWPTRESNIEVARYLLQYCMPMPHHPPRKSFAIWEE